MKVKYYLRGLGTGILVTTLILFVAYSYRDTKANNSERDTTGNQVVQNDSQTTGERQSSSSKDESTSESASDKDNTSDTETTTLTTQTTTPAPTETTPIETTPIPTETTTEKLTEPATEEMTTPISNGTVTTVTFTVRRGASSLEVANQLQALGVIENASDFDRFLVNNGYSRRVKIGEHTVTIGMSYEEIAKIIATN